MPPTLPEAPLGPEPAQPREQRRGHGEHRRRQAEERRCHIEQCGRQGQERRAHEGAPRPSCLPCELTRLQKVISTLETDTTVPTIKRAFSAGVDGIPTALWKPLRRGPKRADGAKMSRFFRHMPGRGKLCAL